MSPEVSEKNSKFAAFVALTKPRILMMVVIMSAAGYFLGAKSIEPFGVFFAMLAGTALSSGGAAVLNNYMERDCDTQMARTRTRPIPLGIVAPNEALIFGLALSLVGVLLLACLVNPLSGFLSLLTVFLYVLVYTPLKRISWWNTVVGAIPGALPPMGGWVSATNELDAGAWILFLILFVWQHPHFYAIAWMYKEDYAKGGFKMLPVVYPDGIRTFRQTLGFSILMIPVSLLPYFYGIAGEVYAVGVTALGVWMLMSSVKVWRSHTVADARSLLKVSVIYLPLFFALLLCDSSL